MPAPPDDRVADADADADARNPRRPDATDQPAGANANGDAGDDEVLAIAFVDPKDLSASDEVTTIDLGDDDDGGEDGGDVPGQRTASAADVAPALRGIHAHPLPTRASARKAAVSDTATSRRRRERRSERRYRIDRASRKGRRWRLRSTAFFLVSAMLYAPVAYAAVPVYRMLRPREPRFVEIAPGLHIGGAIYPWNVRGLRRRGITAVLNCCWEFQDVIWRLVHRKRSYKQLFLPDGTAPSMHRLERAVSYLREAINNGETVLVHCAYGKNRSATVIAAYLVEAGLAESLEHAEQMLVERRPVMFFRKMQRRALESWCRELGKPVHDGEVTESTESAALQ